MSKQHIEQLLDHALNELSLTSEKPQFQIETTKDKQHGDFASNVALVLAKSAQRKPRELAEEILKNLPASPQVKKVEIAGPGFINFFLKQEALTSVVNEILTQKEHYGDATLGQGKKILIEFVSSNPTGPLHVGHGRHAAFGAVIADLLEKIGYQVSREYYVNDAGRQMDILAVSVWLRYLAICGETFRFPANAYQGEYVTRMAEDFFKKFKTVAEVKAEKLFKDLPLDEPDGGDKEIYIDAIIARAKESLGHHYREISDFSLDAILDDMKQDLTEFGVHFDKWFSERELANSDVIDRMIDTLKQKDLVYKKDDALWFRATNFNDEKDRVLQRGNGQRTYFANDLGYHISKFERGFDQAIDIFGSDHHGYIPRMQAGLKAFGFPPEKLTYLLLQFVKLYRGDTQVPMSTRSGSFVPLRELRKEVGNDAARFFYVMRRGEQPVDFDLELAKSKSNENPVYYIQYAHARVCSVFRQLKEKALTYDQEAGLAHISLLKQPHEIALITILSRFNECIVNAAMQHEPHILTNYLRDLANSFHSYYNSEQFIVEDALLRNARLALISATRQIIANGLKLIGVSAPESM